MLIWRLAESFDTTPWLNFVLGCAQVQGCLEGHFSLDHG